MRAGRPGAAACHGTTSIRALSTGPLLAVISNFGDFFVANSISSSDSERKFHEKTNETTFKLFCSIFAKIMFKLSKSPDFFHLLLLPRSILCAAVEVNL